ncbi:MAG TPA: MOSC N-terminal beta barrel domain-containing protein [Planctomycetota bacterium]|nr:MOSC N-terminal beta barrel domain-containing protein [Planctomycetota bacterium]
MIAGDFRNAARGAGVQTAVFVKELWRYPVKSMGGERLDSADLREDGIEGDRVVHAVDAHGRLVTARSHPALLAHRASLGSGGEPLVDGRPWESALVDGVRLVRAAGGHRFDILPLLVATDGAIAAFGRDGRRLRPNIVVGGVEGLAEREWEGRRLRIGRAVVRLEDLRERCVMTTFDPDTQEQDVEVLRSIRRNFGGRLALNASVDVPGTIRVGEPVELA